MRTRLLRSTYISDFVFLCLLMRMLTPTRTRIQNKHCSTVLTGKFGHDEAVAIQAIRFFSPTGQILGLLLTVATRSLFYILSNATFAI
jgi:hypothetical protein